MDVICLICDGEDDSKYPTEREGFLTLVYKLLDEYKYPPCLLCSNTLAYVLMVQVLVS